MSVELSCQDDVAVITLNRPEAHNALNAAMVRRIGECIEEAAASAPRALIFTGAGEKAFCAGADIRELQVHAAQAPREMARMGQQAFARLDALPFPSLAVIQGLALGGGLELALACTFRIACASARLGLPEVRLGLIPAYGGTQRLPRLVGHGRALELIASGRLCNAQEARSIGLVHEIVDIDDPVKAGVQYLERFGTSLPAALNMVRIAVEGALSLPFERGLELEAEMFSAAMGTSDASEGIQAFLEKRAPTFIGR